MDVRIIICGVGRVGRAFLGLLEQKAADLRARYGLSLSVVAAVDMGGAAVAPAGLPLVGVLEHLAAGKRIEELPEFGRPGLAGKAALETVPCELLAETTPTSIADGEPGLTHLRAALANGRHVVTASKGPLVLRYAELKSLAEKAGVRLMISAATAAALPTVDVGLTCLAGTNVLSAEGITTLTPADLARTKAEGKVLKLIGKVERKERKVVAWVAPMALPGDHPLAFVRGTEKAISYLTDTMDRVTVSGGKSNPLGAAAALLKDIIRISQ